MSQTALDIIRKIVVEVEEASPSPESMLSDMKHMKFKVRSISGDIDVLSRIQSHILESLWRIGKLDQIVTEAFPNLSDMDQDQLLDYVEQVEMKTQHQLEAVKMAFPVNKAPQQTLHIEVFRDEKKPIYN